MKTTFGEGFVFRALRWSGCVLAVAALALGAAAVGRAQTSSGGAKSPQKTAAPAAQKAAKPSGGSGGMNTGIKVHGHWTINILSKDGKLVSHHEFENSFQPFGAPLLTNLLGGNATMGSLAILLGSSACPDTPSMTVNGWSGNTCAIISPGSLMVSGASPFINENVNGGYADDKYCTDASGVCAATLTVTPGGLNGIETPNLTLAGTFPVPSPLPANASAASITAVAVTGYSCSTSNTISTCQNGPKPTILQFDFIAPYEMFGQVMAITGTGISPGISVGPGQTIQATVVISFS